MIRNYFGVMYITSKMTIIGNTQQAHDVPETAPEDPLKDLTSGTARRPTGDSQGTNTKIDDFMKKKIFRSNSPCIAYLFLLFTRRKNIQKF